MALTKSDVIREAQKLVARGQIPQAIAEYQKLLRDFPGDGNIHNTIGDLHLKRGAKAEAVEAYEQAATVWRNEGFDLKALAIYKKILNINPGRVETYLSLAELNEARGLVKDANEAYLKVAEHLTKSGQIGRALEIYKRMADLNPDNVKLRVRLVEMYLREGRRSDAVREAVDLARRYEASGKIDEALQELARIRSAIPDDQAVSLEIARLFAVSGRTSEAREALGGLLRADPKNVRALALAADLAFGSGQMSEARRFAEAALEQDSGQINLRELLIEIHLRAGDTAGALASLNLCMDHYRGAGDDAKIDEILDRLVQEDPTSIDIRHLLIEQLLRKGDEDRAVGEYQELAELYVKQGNREKAANIYQKILEHRPEDGGIQRRLHELQPRPLQPEAAAPAAPVVDVRPERRPVSFESAAPPGEVRVEGVEKIAPPVPAPESVGAIDRPVDLTEVDVYLKYQLAGKAVEHLLRLLDRDPNNLVLHTKLRDVYLQTGSPVDALNESLTIADVLESRGEKAGAQTILAEAFQHHPESVVLRERLGLSRPPEAVAPRREEIPTVDLSAFEFAEEQEIEPPPGLERGREEAPSIEVGSEPSIEIERTAYEEPAAPSEPTPRLETAAEAPSFPAAPEEAEETVPTFELEIAAEGPEPEPPTAAVSADDLDDLISEAEFYAQQGLEGEARTLFQRILIAFPDHPGARRGIERLGGKAPEVVPESREAAPAPPAPEAIFPPTPPVVPIPSEEPEGVRPWEEALLGAQKGAFAPGEEAGLQAAFGEIELAPEKEAGAVTPPEAGIPEEGGGPEPIFPEEVVPPALPSISAPPAPEFSEPAGEPPIESFFEKEIEPAAETARPEAPPPLAPAGPEEGAAPSIRLTSEVAPSEEAEAEGEVGDFFDFATELKQEMEVEAPLPAETSFEDKDLEEIFYEFKRGVEQQLGDEDYETHYNLGIAYKEMGLLNEAISEFQLSARDPARFMDACSMLGMCYHEAGRHKLAINEFRKGLADPGHSEEDYLGLRYDLGLAYEAGGFKGEALETFREIVQIDPAFRDAQTRVAEIEKTLSPKESGASPKGKKESSQQSGSKPASEAPDEREGPAGNQAHRKRVSYL
ncbi:MAG: tetratricopeptide repeat protein [Nitrospirae bacterium]|nr:tetratricopeptide repeat protein [Nitrospirota bacterium]